MARKAAKKPRRTSARKAKGAFNEADLNKGHQRKLNALRKSLGDKIANKAFADWLKTQAKRKAAAPLDRNAEMIAEALGALVKGGRLRIPHGGYLVTRGRGRVIVTRAKG